MKWINYHQQRRVKSRLNKLMDKHWPETDNVLNEEKEETKKMNEDESAKHKSVFDNELSKEKEETKGWKTKKHYSRIIQHHKST